MNNNQKYIIVCCEGILYRHLWQIGNKQGSRAAQNNPIYDDDDEDDDEDDDDDDDETIVDVVAVFGVSADFVFVIYVCLYFYILYIGSCVQRGRIEDKLKRFPCFLISWVTAAVMWTNGQIIWSNGEIRQE